MDIACQWRGRPRPVGRYGLLLGLAMMLAGCASVSGFPEPPISAPDELKPLQSYFGPNVLSDYEKLSDAGERRIYRDRLAYGRLRAYDIEFREFERALSEQSETTGLGADLVGLTLNGLGATMGGTATKAALSAASGGVIGAKGAIDKDLFYSKTLPALVAQMEAKRLQVRATIEMGLTKSDDQYPLQLAIVDLGSYERAGSFLGALDSITNDAGTTAAKAEQAIAFARDASFSAQLNAAAALVRRIAALSETQALAVARAMETELSSRPKNVQELVDGIDPAGDRLTDGAVAKRVLKAWASMDQRDPGSQQQWTNALDAATK